MIVQAALKLSLVYVLLSNPFEGEALAQTVTPPNRRAEPIATNPAPNYPEILRRSGQSVLVRMRVVVDTNGRTSRQTRTILVADNPSALMAVDNRIARWRFVPAISNGRPVQDTLDISIRFSDVKDVPLELFDSVAFAGKSPAPGRWEYFVGHAPPDTNAMLPDSAAQFTIAMIMLDTILAQVASTDGKRPDRVACVSAGPSENASQLTVENLAQLKRRGVAVTDARRCPRTFHSQPFVLAESMGKAPSDPPEQDPFALHVKQLQAVSDHEVSGLVVMSEAKRASESSCVATGDSAVPNGWRVRCVTTRVILPIVVHR
jgi:hypothetical protein